MYCRYFPNIYRVSCITHIAVSDPKCCESPVNIINSRSICKTFTFFSFQENLLSHPTLVSDLRCVPPQIPLVYHLSSNSAGSCWDLELSSSSQSSKFPHGAYKFLRAIHPLLQRSGIIRSQTNTIHTWQRQRKVPQYNCNFSRNLLCW